MADKKKKKDKKKDRKRDDKKRSKKSKYSEEDSDDSDDSDSDSSVSEERRKRDRKKKIKKEKDRRKDVSQKQVVAPASNNPYNFDAVPVIPVIKGLNMPVIPPPLPNSASTSTVPKPKIKQPNIFKLLPKLHYGSVIFAKTIYSGEYLSEPVLESVLMEMAKSIEDTTKEEQHKKGNATIGKCIVELEKMFGQEKDQDPSKIGNGLQELVKEKNNRYEHLQKVYHQSMGQYKLGAK